MTIVGVYCCEVGVCVLFYNDAWLCSGFVVYRVLLNVVLSLRMGMNLCSVSSQI